MYHAAVVNISSNRRQKNMYEKNKLAHTSRTITTCNALTWQAHVIIDMYKYMYLQPWMSHIYHSIFITIWVCVCVHHGKQSVLIFCSCVCLLFHVFCCCCGCYCSFCCYIVIALDSTCAVSTCTTCQCLSGKMNVEFNLSGLSDRHVHRVNRLKLPNNTVEKVCVTHRRWLNRMLSMSKLIWKLFA